MRTEIFCCFYWQSGSRRHWNNHSTAGMCQSEKKKLLIEPKGYVLCVFQKFLVFSVIMTFTLNMTGLTNWQSYWKLLGFSSFFFVLFCFVTATLVFRRKRERIVRGGRGEEILFGDWLLFEVKIFLKPQNSIWVI